MSVVTGLAHALGCADHPSAAHVFCARNDAWLHKLAHSFDARVSQGQDIGPLQGAVVAIKGNIDIIGMPTTAGTRSFIPEPAARNAPLVQRLVDAGGLPMGHANMSEFAFSGLGLNPHFGTPLNAWDASLVPGGSSSGCATAIALGIADLGVGTDTSGSTRVPAAYQGIYGFRPTMGRYEDDGILPLSRSLDTPGPMARDLAGLRLLDTVLRRSTDQNARRIDRIVVPDAVSLGPVDPEIKTLMDEAKSALRLQGWQVDVRPVAALANVRDLFARLGTLVASEAPETLSAYTRLDNPALDPNIRRRLQQGLLLDPESRTTLRAARKDLIVQIDAELEGALMMLPTVPALPVQLAMVATDADRFAKENARALSLTMMGAFLDMPSLAMPAKGRRPGHSITLCGVPKDDDTVLVCAERIAPVLFSLKSKVFA